MDDMEYISCIKDGITGICRDIKDKTAREQIALLQEQVTTLGGVDVTELHDKIAELSNLVNNLDLTYAKDEDITALQSQLDKLDDTYAKDEDITALQGHINSIDETIESMESGLNSVYSDTNNNTITLTKVEKIERLYDMNDNLERYNWGYTAGLPNGATISGRDFSKYNKLRCYLKCGSQYPIVDIDLNSPTDSNYNGTDNSYYVESLGQLLVSINVPLDKNSIIVSANYSTQSGGNFVIYKIEGVY